MTKNDKLEWTNAHRKLGELVAWNENPRYLTEKQAKRLRENIRKFGYSQPIEISPDGVILDGHQRDNVMLLMDEYGPDYEIDVRVAPRVMTQTERQEYVIAKHAGAVGSWDWDSLASWPTELMTGAGFDKETLDQWGKNYSNLSELLISENDVIGFANNPEDTRSESVWNKMTSNSDFIKFEFGEFRLLLPRCVHDKLFEFANGDNKSETISMVILSGINYVKNSLS